MEKTDFRQRRIYTEVNEDSGEYVFVCLKRRSGTARSHRSVTGVQHGASLAGNDSSDASPLGPVLVPSQWRVKRLTDANNSNLPAAWGTKRTSDSGSMANVDNVEKKMARTGTVRSSVFRPAHSGSAMGAHK